MSDEINFLMHQHQQQTEFQRKQRELSAQLVCLSEQNVELMRKLEKQK